MKRNSIKRWITWSFDSGLFQNNVLRYYFNTNYLWNNFVDRSYQLSSVISLLSYHQKALLEDGICRRSTYLRARCGKRGGILRLPSKLLLGECNMSWDPAWHSAVVQEIAANPLVEKANKFLSFISTSFSMEIKVA